MPRLDNQSQDIAEYYGFSDIPIQTFERPIVDLCWYCFSDWEGEDRDDVIDHPDYEEQYPAYRCFDCGEKLTERDN